MEIDLDRRFRNYQRRSSRQPQPSRLVCHLCHAEVDAPWDAYREHFSKTHSDLLLAVGAENDASEADREKTTRHHHQKSIEKARPPPTQPRNPPTTTDRRRNPAAAGQSSTRPGNRSAVSRPGTGHDPNVKPGDPAPAQPPVPGPSRPAAQASPVAQQASLDQPAVSPTRSLKRYNSGEQSPQHRSKARPSQSGSAVDDLSRPKSNRTLWTPNAGQPSSGPRAGGAGGGGAGKGGAPPHGQASKSKTKPPLLPKNAPSKAPSHQKQDSHPRGIIATRKKDEEAKLIKQPETRPISQEQLVAEVKGIYAGLVMVESKCIEVDNSQSTAETAIDLNDEQWQALIALHRTLLHEHHDFFLASQHPTAKDSLKDLAKRYAMPARMWRHGIHSFLELLRHRLPGSLEHMLTFVYLAYSMMALLYETVPKFEDTWIECLGDLGRYRMAIEDDSMADRNIWTSVSRHWYSKASDKAPATGRLYHHLAILARPNALQQLFYYSKSLCVPEPFVSARESIMTLFEPILSGEIDRLPEVDIQLVIVHSAIFTRKNVERLQPALDSFINGLDIRIARTTSHWLEPGYFIGISNTCALLKYGDTSSSLMQAMKRESFDNDHLMDDSDDDDKMFNKALELNNRTHRVVWRRFGDPSILSYLHATLVPIYHLTLPPCVIGRIERSVPWKLLSVQLNTLITASGNSLRFENSEFPGPIKGEVPRPLPEDFAMRGLPWADKYLPPKWFANGKIDDDEKYLEVPSMIEERRVRVLWIACQIAKHAKWLLYDYATHQFSVPPHFDEDIDELPLAADQTVVGEDEALVPAQETQAEDMMDTDVPTEPPTSE